MSKLNKLNWVVAAGLNGSTQVSIAGMRGTNSYGTDERPKDFRESILFYNANGSAPLTALMSQMKAGEALTDPEFHWWQELQQQSRVIVTTTVDAAATTLAVAAGSVAGSTGGLSLVPGDVLMWESKTGVFAGTQEYVQVTEVTSDTAIKVSRGAAGSTAAAITSGDALLKVGNAFAEGTLSADSRSSNPVKDYNLAQIFKTDYQVTNTDIKTKKRTGDVLKNERTRKMFDHAVSMEQAYLFGKKHEAVGSNGKPLRYMGGLLSYLRTNKVNFGAGSGGTVTWTEDNFLDAIAPVFDITANGINDERIAFCGNGALTEINKLIKNNTNTRITYEGKIEFFGMKLMQLTIPQGTLYLKTHPLFNQHPVHRYSMVGIAPQGIRDRVLRATKFKDNIQPNNADYTQGEWLTEAGLEVNFEQSHFYFSNVGNKLA